MSLTKATYSMIDGPVGNVKDFGAVGDDVTDDTVAIQAAVDEICAAGGILLFPPGSYKISASITFPNASYRVVGSGPSATAISEILGSGQIPLFDFTGVNGPSTFVEAMGFFGPAPGSYGGTAISLAASNGLCIQDCWFAGVATGVGKSNTASFIRVMNCTFEYCFIGINFDSAIECIVDNSTFYKCVNDYVISNACRTSVFTNSTHIETTTKCVTLDGVTDAIIENITCWQDTTSHTPVIIEMTNACERNIIRNVNSYNYGSKLISLIANKNNVNNLFDGLVFTVSGSPPAGTGANAIEVGQTNENNTFSNFQFDGIAIGIVDAAGKNKFRNGSITNSTTAGIRVQSITSLPPYDSEFSGIYLANNASDWNTLGTVSTVWLSDIDGTLSGLTPTRYGTFGAGTSGRLFYGTAIPVTLPYLLGDRVLNINPVVGQPKAWTCTVAGTPGTWVSEGNL